MAYFNWAETLSISCCLRIFNISSFDVMDLMVSKYDKSLDLRSCSGTSTQGYASQQKKGNKPSNTSSSFTHFNSNPHFLTNSSQTSWLFFPNRLDSSIWTATNSSNRCDFLKAKFCSSWWYSSHRDKRHEEDKPPEIGTRTRPFDELLAMLARKRRVMDEQRQSVQKCEPRVSIVAGSVLHLQQIDDDGIM